jgi:hypothetical protein
VKASAEVSVSGRLDRHPVVQVMIGNAVLLSILYLSTGLILEIVQHFYAAHWVETASIVLDSLPARVLHEVGVLGPITQAYAYGNLSGFWLRFLFAGTTVVIIFLLAGVVAAAMALIARVMRRGS